MVAIPSRSKLSLQAKFLLGLSLILFFFSVFAGCLIYLYEKHQIERDALQKSEMIMAAASSTRRYVQDILRPKMYEILGKDAFVLEAMSSSFISRSIMEYLGRDMPDLQYRRVAVNARNLDFEANPFEREMIRYFAEQPDKTNWIGIRTVDGRQFFKRVQPVRFDGDCQHCHGSPEDAPLAIRASYGEVRGFNKSDGDMAGLVSISIPVDASLARIRETAFSVFGTVLLSVFFLFGLITFFFNRLIVQNLRLVLNVFRETANDEKSEALFEKVVQGDEISELNQAAASLAAHLKKSRNDLADYAENLELKVAARTTALEKSETLLRNRIVARNRELKTLNVIAELLTQSEDLATILPQVLNRALSVIPAKGAGIYLLDESGTELELQCAKNAPELVLTLPYTSPATSAATSSEPGDLPGSICDAAYGRLNFLDMDGGYIESLNLPLCCRDQVLGVMTFVGTGYQEISAELQELLFSIGRQVGITIDSLRNMHRLTAGHDLLQSVFDGITDMVVLLDDKCRFRIVNKAVTSRFHCRPEDFTGNTTREMSARFPHPFRPCSQILAHHKGAEWTEENDIDGTVYETHFYPGFNAKGILEHVICYSKDVTAQKKIESRLHQNEKLSALGQLAAGIAHEVNNPLAVILCHLSLLKEELTDRPEAITDLNTVEKHTRTCQRIIADLLNFAREQKTARQRTDCNDLIKAVVAMTGAQFRKNNISLHLDLSPDLPLLNLAADKIQQVFMNLLVNAGQAIGDSGEIHLFSVYLKEIQRVKIVIEDDGPGIAPALIGKIFDPFFTTKEPGFGTGLGLSLAYATIRDHNGEIEAESEPGHWTRFTVILPTGE